MVLSNSVPIRSFIAHRGVQLNELGRQRSDQLGMRGANVTMLVEVVFNVVELEIAQLGFMDELLKLRDVASPFCKRLFAE